jgi:hypothetical protein
MRATDDHNTGVMVLRAWVESGQSEALRVRVFRIVDRGDPSSVTVTTVDEACDIVRAWLQELLASAHGQDGQFPV